MRKAPTERCLAARSWSAHDHEADSGSTRGETRWYSTGLRVESPLYCVWFSSVCETRTLRFRSSRKDCTTRSDTWIVDRSDGIRTGVAAWAPSRNHSPQRTVQFHFRQLSFVSSLELFHVIPRPSTDNPIVGRRVGKPHGLSFVNFGYTHIYLGIVVVHNGA